MFLVHSATKMFTDPALASSTSNESGYQASPRAMGGSRRSRPLEILRDAMGEITSVRIGRWRELTSSPSRQIVEVRPVALGRVAVKLQQSQADSDAACLMVWQLYDLNGRLLALLQSSGKDQPWVATKYESDAEANKSADSQLFLSA